MPFIHDDFLLSTESAKRLYHDHAKAQPIYDYHCHLPPDDLAADRTFNNLAEIWLDGDHYKWRAMRANGVDEILITGDADPYDKFAAWAQTVPYTLRNPLYHWTHLELKRTFEIDGLLNGDTAQEVWDETERQLKAMPVSAILNKFNVALIGTTDDPADDLTHHKQLTDEAVFKDTAIYPAFRPDKAVNTQDVNAWNVYIDQLASAAGVTCNNLDCLLGVMAKRLKFFHAAGCRLSDHGLSSLPSLTCTREQAETVFTQLRGGRPIDAADQERFTRFILLHLSGLYAKHGWTQQYHLGPMRNNHPKAFRELGPDTGFDSIGDTPQGAGLSSYLGELADRDTLSKTVLYNLNPRDNYLFAAMAGNFQGGTPGKVQHGSGWWFLDQEEAMRWQINALSNIGLLSRFVGMLTDSRSFMSYPRHEYFRRILCDLLGSDMETGRLPSDMTMIGRMVEDICFNNARDYFGMALKGKHADG